MKKFRVIIFDLDGVIIDSKKNMMLSWNFVKKELNLKQNFNQYFNYVGYPFQKILRRIGIKRNFNKIQKAYKKQSIINFKHIKLMSGIIKVINILKKNKIKLAIVTSKDINRTKLIVKKFNIPIKIIISPQNKLRGKPFPDQLKLAMKKLKCFQKETCYIGDMHVDYKAAKNSNIGFIFAKYGYGVKKNIYGKIINKPMDILKFI